MHSVKFLLLIVLGLSALSAVIGEKKIFCYFSSFAQHRQGIGKFLPEDIDPYLCTHLIYAFVDITPDGRDLMAFNWNDKGEDGLYARTMALRQKNPSLKILLAVGGWQIGSKPFIPMIRSHYNRQAWVKNVVRYLRQYNFDGFDMDWEFPATRGSPPEDKHRFTLLMKELYEAFRRESEETGNEKLLLTCATASGTYYIAQSYEPYEIIKYMDFMLLMTYNYHGHWAKFTGHHSGLWKHPLDPPGEQSELHTQWSIDYWLDTGIPKNKLILGIPTYGMSFTLANPRQTGIRAPARGGGRMGPYTSETGILSYYEICEKIQKEGWTTKWINEQGVPYAYGGDQWVGFENADSAKLKAENIIDRNLAGAFVWSIEMDDFGNVCGEGNYPILSMVAKILRGIDSKNRLAHGESTPLWHPTPSPTPEPIKKTRSPWKPKSPQDSKKSKSISSKVNEPKSPWSPRKPSTPKKSTSTLTTQRPKVTQRPLTKPTPIEKSRTSWKTKKSWSARTPKPSNEVAKSSAPIHTWTVKPSQNEVGDKEDSEDIWPKSPWSPRKPKYVKTGASKKKITDLPRQRSSWSTRRPTTTTKKQVTKNSRSKSSWNTPKSQQTRVTNSEMTEPSWPKSPWSTRKPKPILKEIVQQKSWDGSKRRSIWSTMKPKPAEKEVNDILDKDASWRKSPWSPRKPKYDGKKKTRRPSWTSRPTSKNWNARPTGKPIVTRRPITTPKTVERNYVHTRSPSAAGSADCSKLGTGMFRDPSSCERFIMCLPGGWRDYGPFKMNCPLGTRFDENLGICNHATEVKCWV